MVMPLSLWSLLVGLVATLRLLCLEVDATSASAEDPPVYTDWLAVSKAAPRSSSVSPPPAVCPAQCDCFNYRETVDCSRRNLDQIPDLLRIRSRIHPVSDPGLTLDQIPDSPWIRSRIHPGSDPGLTLDQIPDSLPTVVRRLYVEGNRIEDLGDGRLSAATNLSVLIVEDNQLTELNVDALYRLRTSSLLTSTSTHCVDSLVTEDNQLTELNVDALCRLIRLQELDVSGNQIQTIVSVGRCGARLTALKELNLGHNRLSTLPANLSAMAPNLEILKNTGQHTTV